ncbi:MAG: hypothetical protein VB041_11070, partial [Candidatus Limiplasma sp.]|nr:hypothetical protein [Candidatus Limiplasma sp.]
MCEFFGVRSGDSRNNNNIKSAIEALETDGLLKSIKDGRTYTLTLSKRAEQRKSVIRIQKAWIEIAKSYQSDDPNNSVSWMALLKVWLFAIQNHKDVVTAKEIAEELSLSVSIVKNAKRALAKDIKAINIQRKTEMIEDGVYRC